MTSASDKGIGVFDGSPTSAPVTTPRGVGDVLEGFCPRSNRAAVCDDDFADEREIGERANAWTRNCLMLERVLTW